jgi:hypothetical protein
MVPGYCMVLSILLAISRASFIALKSSISPGRTITRISLLYFLVYFERQNADLEVAHLEKEIPETEKQVRTEFQETTNLLGTISSFDRGTTVSSLGTLVEQFIPGISVREVLYEKTSADKAQVSIRGIAEKREDLISFIEHLRAVPTFTEVTSPVSNLLKEEYLDFSITLVEVLKTATSSKK